LENEAINFKIKSSQASIIINFYIMVYLFWFNSISKTDNNLILLLSFININREIFFFIFYIENSFKYKKNHPTTIV
jgi:hypothetical protein